jgi:hypothetical protein
MKMRLNRSQDFIIGGYSVGGSTFDAVILGHVVDGKLVYVARTRNGFTPATRADLLRRMKPLEVTECLFCNVPEKRLGRWGEGLTEEKMKDCRWLKPNTVHLSMGALPESPFLALPRSVAGQTIFLARNPDVSPFLDGSTSRRPRCFRVADLYGQSLPVMGRG